MYLVLNHRQFPITLAAASANFNTSAHLVQCLSSGELLLWTDANGMENYLTMVALADEILSSANSVQRFKLLHFSLVTMMTSPRLLIILIQCDISYKAQKNLFYSTRKI